MTCREMFGNGVKIGTKTIRRESRKIQLAQQQEELKLFEVDVLLAMRIFAL